MERNKVSIGAQCSQTALDLKEAEETACKLTADAGTSVSEQRVVQASSKVTDEYPENENVLQRVGEVSLYCEVPKGNPTTQRAPTNERVKSPLAQGGLPGQPSPTPKETRIWS